ncbi:MAG: hypothetical protein FWF10_01320 [Clostridiales bacterium]|nr:hypothetical protein [Clostridiales bacterium]
MIIDYPQKQRIGFTYVLDLLAPASPYGRALLRKLRPFAPREVGALQRELDAIEAILSLSPALLAQIEEQFAQLRDIRGSLSRIGGALDEVDLFEIKCYLLILDALGPLFARAGFILAETLPALELLDPEGNRVASFAVSERFSPALAEIRAEKRNALPDARADIIERERAEEEQVMERLSAKLLPWKNALQQNADSIAHIDLRIQKAKLARQYHCAKPAIGTHTLHFAGMVNPQIANFTPLHISLAPGATVLTGYNMGGKSVTLKTLALNVLLIHCGFYPFAESASCPLFDQLYLVSEDLEDATRSLSSFGGEVVRLREIAGGEGFALILLDEPARGTNPAEGGAIARGLCAYLNAQKNISVIATHYEGVAARANAHYRAAGLQDIDIETLCRFPEAERPAQIARHMDYGIAPVSPDQALPANALMICRLLGLGEELMRYIISET